ncbi:MAG: X2-like carbohydrate binding domain-containing protein, partial [Eubacteriales bacterium]|nr:X2-like carbohydrate binding domain-containing protein [Eubacteriales bacterium]
IDGIPNLPAEPTKEGYTLGGWFTEIDGAGIQLVVGAKLNDNITVYAKWAEVPVENATVNPTTVKFDKKTAAQADVVTTITWNSANKVNTVKKGETSLTIDTDYIVDGTTLTIKKEFLAMQAAGEVVISIEFDKGHAASLTIKITDTTPTDVTKTVSSLFKNGFTVEVNPAVDGLVKTDFSLKDDANQDITIDSVATNDNGASYTVVTTLTAGKTYTVNIIKEGYNFGDAANILVTEVEKITPVVNEAVAATSVDVGRTLADSILSGTFKNEANEAVDGTLTWDAPDTVVNETGDFNWTFTPTDTATYNVVKGTVSVKVLIRVNTTVVTSGSAESFKVNFDPAVNGLTGGNFALSLGDQSIGISVSGGPSEYWVTAVTPLTRKQAYSLTITKEGYNFGEPIGVLIPGAGEVKGKVLDNKNNPLKDVNVSIFGGPVLGKDTMTNDSGEYSIQNVIEGTYSTLSFAKHGHVTKHLKDITVENGKTIEIEDQQLLTENQAKMAKARANLTLGDLTAVTANLTLPATQDDATITWVSSNTEVITNDGKVTRPAFVEGDATVTLTATITVGSESDTKTFTVTVLAMEAPATHIITIATVVGGTANISIDKSEGVPANDKVTVWIANIEPGKQFKSITVTDAVDGAVATTEVEAGKKYTFTMPAKAVTIKVELESIPPAAPKISSAVCKEGSAINEEEEDGLGSSDTLTITFNIPTNKIFKQLFQNDIDLIIDWGDKSFGESYNGFWNDNKTLKITCLDPTGATFVAGDSIAIKAGADVRAKDGLSAPSSATAVTTGDFEPYPNSIWSVSPLTGGLVEAPENEGSFRSEPSFSKDYIVVNFEKQIAGDIAKEDITANNLPAGLDFTIVKKLPYVIEIYLTGKAINHGASDSITNLSFTFAKDKVKSRDADLTTKDIPLTFVNIYKLQPSIKSVYSTGFDFELWDNGYDNNSFRYGKVLFNELTKEDLVLTYSLDETPVTITELTVTDGKYTAAASIEAGKTLFLNFSDKYNKRFEFWKNRQVYIKAPGPTGLIGVPPTSVGGNDGKIIGIEPAKIMDYRIKSDPAVNWIKTGGTVTELTGLSAGTYEVMIAASVGSPSSYIVEVTVPPFKNEEE